MTRKYLVSFTISFIILVSLGIGIFGKHGVISNRILRQTLEDKLYAEEMLRLQVEELERTEKEVSQGDELKDVAFRLGYTMDGDTVYYFSEPDVFDPLEDDKNEVNSQDGGKDFSGLSFGVISAIAGGISLAVIATMMLAGKRRSFRDDDIGWKKLPGDGQREKYDDYF
ncbi:septum formation initiator [Parasphaerochaeta coccoides]|uniref:Septum formation initiator n=1 Tax=Parasphaerochaeta coccoides (strain ATCC BAA-1237 / DSM 17374 / SPN1) TaxID=760011 RepID=F4GK01_PARC1|nr:septum formation initiator [Parasphaerochaeta coccoides]AEC01773.1 Septum formation initiator [Parasphaerochaeta coccoides DSM 17374]